MPLPVKGYTPSHLDRNTGKFVPKPIRPVEVPIGPSIAYVCLTQDQWCLIDREDAAFLGQWNWIACWARSVKGFYACRMEKVRPGKQKMVRMHSFLLGLTGYQITADHVNRNTLDNRRSNLRPATRSLQCLNRRKKSGTSSRFPGVFKATGNRWRASINIGLGYFSNEDEAHAAYRAAVERHRKGEPIV